MVLCVYCYLDAEDQPIYFLVGPVLRASDHNDSYVVSISKPEDIEHARYLIKSGAALGHQADEATVVARVTRGSDGVNRDYLDPTFREWSWHVIEFLGFADYVAEVLDGTPTLLEAEIKTRVSTEPFNIGFNSHTIVRELGPAPLYLSAIPALSDVALYWSWPGTNYVFTLEITEGLSSMNWIAVPGFQWPVRADKARLPKGEVSGFLRVRADLCASHQCEAAAAPGGN